MQLFVSHPDDTAASVPPAHVRRFIPPPAQLLPRVKAWALKWTRDGFDQRTDQHIFTLDTYRVLKCIMKGIVEWRLSGRCLLCRARPACTCV